VLFNEVEMDKDAECGGINNDEAVDFGDGNWELGILAEPSVTYFGGSKKLTVNLILIDSVIAISLSDDDIEQGLGEIEVSDVSELDGLVVGVSMADGGIVMHRHELGQVSL
jgi:hypothetical protein